MGKMDSSSVVAKRALNEMDFGLPQESPMSGTWNFLSLPLIQGGPHFAPGG